MKAKQGRNVELFRSGSMVDLNSGSGQSKMFERPRTSVVGPKKLRYVALTRTNNFKERYLRATMVREQLEDADVKRKFLLIHRKEINKQHVFKFRYFHCLARMRF